MRQWAARHPTSAMEPRSDLTVPFICSLMPMRWSYEALVFAQSKMNPLTRRQENIQRQIDQLAALPNPSPAQEERLEDLKDLLAILSGLQAKSASALNKAWTSTLSSREDRSTGRSFEQANAALRPNSSM